jgi:FkbM family methyltransferase
VRFGLFCFRIFNHKKRDFVIQAELFPEKLTFELNLNCGHERMAYLMGHYENETSSTLAELYQGGTVLDVGANIGLISIPLAMRIGGNTSDSDATIYSFEPIESNFESLRRNVKLNNLNGSVIPLKKGLGNKDTQVFIQLEGDDLKRTGTANILPLERDFVRIPIQITSIDRLIVDGDLPVNVSLMKIDTDGYDFEVIKGAKRLLQESRPIVLAELNEHCMNWHGYGIREVMTFLEGINYEIWAMNSSRPQNSKRLFDPIKHAGDCLLIPSEKSFELREHEFKSQGIYQS